MPTLVAMQEVCSVQSLVIYRGALHARHKGCVGSALLRADWVFGGNDLDTTDGLESAVLVSLLTDRLANADDEIPDGTGDRRGWWGDMALPLTNAPPAGDLIGSRLWLLSRRKVTEETRLDAITYCVEALQWLIDDGIAASVDVQAAWNADTLGRIDSAIAISRTDATVAPPHRGSISVGPRRSAFLWPGPDGRIKPGVAQRLNGTSNSERRAPGC